MGKPLDDYLDMMIIDDNDCWYLPIKTRSIRIDGKPISISRLIYEHFNDKSFPYRTRLWRLCENSECLNPSHLYYPSEEERFLYFVHKTDSCWNWVGATDGGGYGIFIKKGGERSKAHRYIWERIYGNIPKRMCICHHCDNPSCVNPKHLFLGTQKDNVQDKMNKGRFIKMKGRKNGRSIMTKDKVIELRKLYKSGNYTYMQLVKRFGISQTQVARIVKKESWSWVD